MKKILLTLLGFLLCGTVMFASERIMVIADPHVYPHALIEADPDFDAYLAKQRKMIDLSEAAWYALMDTALKYKPSLLLIPGDLTRHGEPESHDLVAASLRELQAQGIPSLVIPGNHDLPDQIGWDSVYSWVYESAVSRDETTHSYVAEPLSGVTVLGIDASRDDAGTGVVSNETLEWLLAQADSAADKGNSIIAMCHWQLLEHVDGQGMIDNATRILKADAVRDSLMNHGVYLVLTGHFHVNGITTYRDTASGSNSIVEITTGSPITFPCAYRWLTLSDNKQDFAVETGTITALENIPDLYSYSRQWMAEHARVMIPSVTKTAWNKLDNYWDLVGRYIGQETAALLKKMLPSDDSTRVALVDKYLGDAIVNLYLLYSAGNEPYQPQAQSLADAFYAGVDSMMAEMIPFETFRIVLTPIIQQIIHEPLQSLVEDITGYGTLYADHTDDLWASFRINGEKLNEDVPSVQLPSQTDKFIREGQLLIRREGQIYTVQGQKIQ